jgi:hypothetical protein
MEQHFEQAVVARNGFEPNVMDPRIAIGCLLRSN